jgi:general secretion pathway protein C
VNKVFPLQTAVVLLLTLCALALLSLVVVSRLWLWMSPAPQAPASPAQQQALSVQSTYGLFGIAAQSSPAISLLPATTSLAFRLLGIVAAQGAGSDYAVVQIAPGNIVAVEEGREIAPGVRLTTVNTDHIILERAGAQETLAWPRP